jgi:hypothetical protein
MNFLAGSMAERLDTALIGGVAIVVVQIFCILGALIFKHRLAPMPIAEIILRPLFIPLIDRLNRSDRTDFALIIRGMIVFIMILAILFGFLYFFKIINVFVAFNLSFLPLILFLSPLSGLLTVYFASKGRNFQSLSIGLNQNLIPTDEHGMRREGGKLLSLALTDWFLFPFILFIVLGWPALLAFATVSIFCRLSASPDSPFTMLFQKAYNLTAVILNVIIMPFMIFVSFFSIGASPVKILRATKHPYLLVLACFAYGQNVVLGGTYQNRYGETVKRNWVGPKGATARVDHMATIRFMIYHWVTVFLTIAMLLAASFYL